PGDGLGRPQRFLFRRQRPLLETRQADAGFDRLVLGRRTARGIRRVQQSRFGGGGHLVGVRRGNAGGAWNGRRGCRSDQHCGLVVYAAQPLTPLEAALAAGLALCGGLLQILLSIALWPVRRYEPERRSLAALYSELARIATHPSEAGSAPLGTKELAQAQNAL